MSTPVMTPPALQAPPAAPARLLKTNRSLGMFILLSIVTFGIYAIVAFYTMVEDINLTAQRDGKKTMNYLLVLLLSMVTFGIFAFVFFHTFTERVGNEARRRHDPQPVSVTDFWLWYVVGSLIIVGPFIYLHKLFTSMNIINSSYNQHGA